MKKIKVGTGITEREHVMIESDDLSDWVERNEAAWDCVGHIESQAIQILNNAGLPTEPAAYWDHPAPAMQSLEWYALEALRMVGRLRQAMKDGKCSDAGCCGVFLGQLWAEAALKFHWEEAALKGVGQEKNLREGRESGLSDEDIMAVVNDPKYPTRQKQADKLGLSVRQLHRRLKNMT